jgi:phosphoglycerate dehydrogenase-like enzyme
MIRVGFDASLDQELFHEFTKAVELVPLPVDLNYQENIDFWVAPLHTSTFRRQLPLLRGVKAIQLLWAGVDTLLPWIPPEVIFCDARGVHDIPTAEWVITAIFAMQKYLPFYLELQREGSWARRIEGQQFYLKTHRLAKPLLPSALVDEVADSTVLIVGYGSIGKALEVRLAPCGCKILRIARTVREGVFDLEQLDKLLPKADIVVLLLPLTPETSGLMSAERIAKMRPGALLVNAARGSLVNTDALLQALEAGRIRAALDVTDPEPLPDGHPLWRAPNILITPHIAGSSGKFIGRVIRFVSEQAERFAKGQPLLNVVSEGY